MVEVQVVLDDQSVCERLEVFSFRDHRAVCTLLGSFAAEKSLAEEKRHTSSIKKGRATVAVPWNGHIYH